MDGVIVRGELITAAQCKRCGAKFFPAEQIEKHLADHKRADDEFIKSKKWLGSKLNRIAGKRLS